MILIQILLLKLSPPSDPKYLGFEAQKVLAVGHLSDEYDLFGYMEDDLIIHDPLFFHKIISINSLMGFEYVLLPHRFEFFPFPHNLVDRFYIDGPICENELDL